MEELVKKSLGCSTLNSFGFGGGGCISSGQGYSTDTHGQIFVKINSKDGARVMFDGEFASLEALHNTGTIRIPRPHKVLDNPDGGAFLVMEYLDMGSLHSHGAKLGEQLARLHMHNSEMMKKNVEKESSVHTDHEQELQYVNEFGFEVPTCCGYLPQDNTWNKDWVEFYARNKLQQQLTMAEKEYNCREAKELWGKLERKLPELFKDITIQPALVHGDLWGGNVAEIDNEPVIFDPASFYGHSEYDLGIACMFGGFPASFWTAYHKVIPKDPGFEKRNKLYQLFHYLNHWNHFGGSYKDSALSIMRQLSK